VLRLLGPNSAGKTSTIRAITCVSPVTDGELLVDGLDVSGDGRRIKARLGVVPQEDNLDPDLPVRQSLFVYARYFDIPAAVARQRIDEVLSLFQLQDRAQEVVDNLSGGMKRRLSIARALLNQPKILVLDEPTTGLDPQARHLVWQKLRLLKSQGVTMLLSTHNMEEAAPLRPHRHHAPGAHTGPGPPADPIAATWAEKSQLVHDQTEEKLAWSAWQASTASLWRMEDVVSCRAELTARASPPESSRPGAARPSRSATLEDVFLRLTGRGLAE
jgi:lipooligosaccharide transport system ATP-binding protein